MSMTVIKSFNYEKCSFTSSKLEAFSLLLFSHLYYVQIVLQVDCLATSTAGRKGPKPIVMLKFGKC